MGAPLFLLSPFPILTGSLFGILDCFAASSWYHFFVATAERKSFQERFTLGRIVDHLELLESSNGRQTGETSVVENSPHISLDNQGFKESVCMSSSKSRNSVTKQSSCVVDSSSQLEEVDMGSWSVGAGTVDSSSSSIVGSQSSISENDSALIKRQLCHIENQQSSILELLQVLLRSL